MHHWFDRIRESGKERVRIPCPSCGADLVVERTNPRGVVVYVVFRVGAERADAEFAVFGESVYERVQGGEGLPRARRYTGEE
jgi:hypothetical protein